MPETATATTPVGTSGGTSGGTPVAGLLATAVSALGGQQRDGQHVKHEARDQLSRAHLALKPVTVASHSYCRGSTGVRFGPGCAVRTCEDRRELLRLWSRAG